MKLNAYDDEKPKICIFVDKVIDGYEIIEKILFRNRFDIHVICDNSNGFSVISRYAPDLILVCKALTSPFSLMLIPSPYKLLFILDDKHSWLNFCSKYLQSNQYEYIVKPYDCREISTKIDQILGLKSTVADAVNWLCYKDFLKLDCNNNRIFINSVLVELTEFETLLLRLFIEQSGRFLQCRFVNSWLRSNGLDLSISSNNLSTAICRLKSKLFVNTGYVLIKSRYGKGYFLCV